MIEHRFARGVALGRTRVLLAALASCVSACAQLRGDVDAAGTVPVEAGSFLMGSTLDDRAMAIELAHASSGRVTPEATLSVKREFRRTKVPVGAFRIMVRPVTQRDYFAYVLATGAPEPYVDPNSWARLALGHDYREVEQSLWRGDGPRPGRMDHPVVLVSQHEAAAYCQWWGAHHNAVGQLPSEVQWEKAARGEDGQRYPWGDDYHPGKLNAAEAGPGTTVAVGSYPEGASPYGALDMAGNVFEWTRTRDGEAQYIVKGGAWNSDGASARAAARHARPQALRHISVGFRCVLNPVEDKAASARGRRGNRRSARSGSATKRVRQGGAKGEAGSRRRGD
ncbi:MAG: formylglycine-generating enzyme family protein [Myxococcales bacterium FL481]|nr:MAG: formylglycine-generating enzyme family protein [Myxococcales bacterium FL481]